VDKSPQRLCLLNNPLCDEIGFGVWGGFWGFYQFNMKKFAALAGFFAFGQSESYSDTLLELFPHSKWR
jgi:hypothetical protein